MLPDEFMNEKIEHENICVVDAVVVVFVVVVVVVVVVIIFVFVVVRHEQ